MKRDISLTHEIIRKILHICAGIAFVGISLFIDNTWGQVVLLRLIFFALLVSLVTDYFRIEQGWRHKDLAFLERAREYERLHATTYTFIGALLAFSFFDRDIAYAGIIMFFIGDAAAAIFGRLWGKRKLLGKKSVLGTGIMFVLSLIAGLAILTPGVAIVMAIVATLVELLSNKMDDSFMIILFSGVVGQLLRVLV